jgi:adenosine deaminase
LLEAAEAAEDAVGGQAAIAYVVACERHESVADAVALAKVVAGVVQRGEHVIKGRKGIVGFGLHAAERGNPPAPFAEAFSVCRAVGIRSLPHAGEFAPGNGISGAQSIVSCIDDLGASRILHGVRAVDDAALVERLVALGDAICLDMCPSSNALLGVVPSIEEHPLPVMLRAGVSMPFLPPPVAAQCFKRRMLL